ncbi:STAS domain-containing protein [Streptomyces sp. NPDC090106]|uniref:STAS domain-containing protein n=1 Tax=Streptomyces sp. NPDC090106 TaxID=3365946 RepID=UPI00381DEB78
MNLYLGVSTHPGDTLVNLTGELDRQALEQISEITDRLDGSRHLTLDLSGLTFMDSSGLYLLLELRRRTETAGGTLELRGVRGPALRVLELTGTRGLFTLLPPLHHAA